MSDLPTRRDLVSELKRQLSEYRARGGPDDWEATWLLHAAQALSQNERSAMPEAWLRLADESLDSATIPANGRGRPAGHPIAMELLEEIVSGLRPD